MLLWTLCLCLKKIWLRVLGGACYSTMLPLSSRTVRGLRVFTYQAANQGIDLDRELFFTQSQANLLLKKLHEVTLWSNQGCEDDYLGILARILKVSGSKDALKRLDILRLAFARYFARCTLKGSSFSGRASMNDS